jgi:hypothetical protein
VVEKMLSGGASVRLKERALFVVSQNRTDRARDILGNVARSSSNPDLQLLAVRYLGQSNTPEAITILTTVYRGDSSMDVRRAIISALASSRGNAWTGRGAGAGTGSSSPAITALVTIARAERNPELRTLIVRHLSNSSAPEAQKYMLELLQQ